MERRYPVGAGRGIWNEGSQATRGSGPSAPAVPGSAPRAGAGITSRTSWPAAPNPRASASVETVTPERYGRYDSPKIAMRSDGSLTAGSLGWWNGGRYWIRTSDLTDVNRAL